MDWRRFVAFALFLGAQVQAQTTPLALARTVVERWAAGSAAEFGAVCPFREAREAFSEAEGDRDARLPGLAEVVQSSSDRAVLLISGVPRTLNSGDATIAGRGFSGVYEARSEGGVWKLSARVPLESMGQIVSHRMVVTVRPGSGIAVEDRMRIRVKGSQGFAARLNHAAKVEAVVGSEKHFFGGGLLWADLPAGETELTLKYSIEVEHGPDGTNSGSFVERSGHVRNQYFWHPFFDFNSSGDLADFDVEIRIPKEFRATTSLEQTERVEGAERVIHAKTSRPTFALTLVYDRDWNVESASLGQVRLETFLTPQFRPDAEVVRNEFRTVYALLSERFGPLPDRYFAVVEARSIKGGNAWRFASNQIVVAAGLPRMVSYKMYLPGAPLGHEIGHFWTHGAGPAATFLQEGWAVYVESLILGKEFGEETVRLFWKNHADEYFRLFEGNASLMEDANNAGVTYAKGAWVFRMIEEAMEAENFQKGMAEFSRQSLAKPSGWEVLAECMQHYAPEGFDARAFLAPWLLEKRAPRLTVVTKGAEVTIRQDGPLFVLPVTVEATTARGAERKRIWIRAAETAIAFSGDVLRAEVDPAGELLLRR
jgi:hypothetical protein